MDKKKPTSSSDSTNEKSTNKLPTPAKGASNSAQTPTKHTAKRYIPQNFSLMWLDDNINESKADFRNSLTRLRSIVNTIDIFIDADKCITFLKEITNEKVFMIVSGSLGQNVVPIVHGICPLHSIFVFCQNKSRHEQWAKNWSKVIGVFTNIDHICVSLKQAAQQCDHDSMSMSFVGVDEKFSSNQNLNQLDQYFMYTQLFKDIFVEIKHNDVQSIKELSAYCRGQYADNEKELEKIKEFEQDYHRHTPIWWYTYDCFLYRILNRSLFAFEVDRILKLGFFIHDLHRDIAQINSKQSGKHHRQPFTVYRGQGMLKIVFERLMHAKGGLISFNNFLSTSKNREVSSEFAYRALSNPNSVGILFTMTIDPMVSSAPFASLETVSSYSSEQEIIFSMNTVFRISEIKPVQSNKRLWQVKLVLTSDDDFQLSALLARMREETSKLTGWDRLGRLLIQLGEFDKFEQVYRSLLDQPSDDIERASAYKQLGDNKTKLEEYTDAVMFYTKAIEIDEKRLPPNHPTLASDYTDMAETYTCMGEHAKAISFCEKALAINQKVLLPNNPQFAGDYDNIALLYNKMGECKKAIPFMEKALQIRQTIHPPIHVQLSADYTKIGLLYASIDEHSKALSFLEKSLAIDQKLLSANHPELAIDYNIIGNIYRKMNEYSKALEFHKKALGIYLETHPPTHLSLVPSYNAMGHVYNKMGEYSKALSFYGKAFEINQKSLALNDPELVDDCINMGSVYQDLGDYSKALSFFKKSLEISEKVFPVDNLSLVPSYRCMGSIYQDLGDYSKALSFFKKSLEISEKAFPVDDISMVPSYRCMGSIYQDLGDYSKALSFLEKSIQIQQKTLPPNHIDLAYSYMSIGWAYKNIGQYSKALSFYEKSLRSLEKNLPPIHAELGNMYNNIGEVFCKMGEYTKALGFLDKAIQIDQKTLPPNHRNLAESYNNIGEVHDKMGDNSKALSFYQRAVEIGHRSLPANHPFLQKWRRNLETIRKKF